MFHLPLPRFLLSLTDSTDVAPGEISFVCHYRYTTIYYLHRAGVRPWLRTALRMGLFRGCFLPLPHLRNFLANEGNLSPGSTSVEFILNNLLLALCVSLSLPLPHLWNFHPHNLLWQRTIVRCGKCNVVNFPFSFAFLLLDRRVYSARQYKNQK